VYHNGYQSKTTKNLMAKIKKELKTIKNRWNPGNYARNTLQRQKGDQRRVDFL
jgi:hypothetical protein